MLRRALRLFAPRGKVGWTAQEAIADIKDNMTLLVGGFGLCGTPHALLVELQKTGVKGLTVISNDPGTPGWGLGVLLESKQIKRMLSSFVGENREFGKQYIAGEVELELMSQGTFAERVRAGAAGIPAFYVPSSCGTVFQYGGFPIRTATKNQPAILSSPKETRVFNNRAYVMETALTGDFSLIKAYKADEAGNVVFRGTARNFNPELAGAGRICIAEVEEVVPIGALEPDSIHLPGIYVHRIVQTKYKKPVDSIRVIPEGFHEKDPYKLSVKERIARRAALELQDGMYVNLGIGIPNLVAQYVPKTIKVTFQSENGLLGVGPYPKDQSEVDADIINAGKQPVTFLKSGGSATFSSAESFAMIRGGHLSLSLLGGMEVTDAGDLANWIVPGAMVKGPGGGMDLVAAPNTEIVIVMEHCAKDGSPKIIPQCTLPLTGQRVADLVITELGVFKLKKRTEPDGGIEILEIAQNVTLDQVRAKTGVRVDASPNLRPMRFSGYDE